MFPNEIDHQKGYTQAQIRRNSRRTPIEIARGFDDLLMVYAIRAAVYMAEQDCPFAEEFDGNDHCATHFIGRIQNEPAGCLRARFFHDFVKLERLAVRKAFRKSTLAFDLVRAAIDHARRKGFRRVYGHARKGLEPFWARFGAEPVTGSSGFVFSDHAYTEMVIELDVPNDAVTISSGPMVILRPEGAWDRPGILEQSSQRPVRDASGNTISRN